MQLLASLVGVAALKALNTSAGVNQLLLAGVEGMALAANFNADLRLGIAGMDHVAACAGNGAVSYTHLDVYKRQAAHRPAHGHPPAAGSPGGRAAFSARKQRSGCLRAGHRTCLLYTSSRPRMPASCLIWSIEPRAPESDII